MEIEILHIDDCPNWEEVGGRLRIALDATDHRDAQIDYSLITSPSEAERVPFAGSPTILVDGTDLFPSDGRTNDLACRIYSTPAGFAGLPTLDQLREALASRASAYSG